MGSVVYIINQTDDIFYSHTHTQTGYTLLFVDLWPARHYPFSSLVSYCARACWQRTMKVTLPADGAQTDESTLWESLKTIAKQQDATTLQAAATTETTKAT